MNFDEFLDNFLENHEFCWICLYWLCPTVYCRVWLCMTALPCLTVSVRVRGQWWYWSVSVVSGTGPCPWLNPGSVCQWCTGQCMSVVYRAVTVPGRGHGHTLTHDVAPPPITRVPHHHRYTVLMVPARPLARLSGFTGSFWLQGIHHKPVHLRVM